MPYSAPSSRYLMRVACLVATVVFSLCAASAGQSSTFYAGAPHAVPPSNPQSSTPVARSEMQQPKPIPVIRSLRLPEIPVVGSKPETGQTLFQTHAGPHDNSPSSSEPGPEQSTLLGSR